MIIVSRVVHAAVQSPGNPPISLQTGTAPLRSSAACLRRATKGGVFNLIHSNLLPTQ